MPQIFFDCGLVLDRLARFSQACGTQESAAKRLGVAKGTLSKWFKNRTIGVGSLQSLAAFNGDADLAKAAQEALANSGIELASFNFAHIASQLMLAGAGAEMLFQMLERNATPEDLEFGAAHDLVSAFADLQYYNALSEVAQDEFQQVPDPPMLQLGRTDYEQLIFLDDEEDEAIATGPARLSEIDISKIDWEKINEPYTQRSDAARLLLNCVCDDPPHRLLEHIIETLYCRIRNREDTDRIIVTKEECCKIAALAAADCYTLESVVMEAADVIRLAADTHRTLATKPLYALATKFYDVCQLNRTFTISRLVALTNRLAEDKETVSRIEGICAFVHRALYSEEGVYFFQAGVASAKVNAHGSVIDYESRPAVRSVVGKKRKAPKQAIVRDKSMLRRPYRNSALRANRAEGK